MHIIAGGDFNKPLNFKACFAKKKGQATTKQT